jgi:hypothetical protein
MRNFLSGTKILARGRMDNGLATFADVGGCNILLDQKTLLATPSTIDISSTSALDTAAGTGARTIKIFGLGSDKKYQDETITLNGNTVVTSTKTWYRVFAFRVITFGNTGSNQGSIFIIKTGTGGTYSAGTPGVVTSASMLCKGLATANQGTTGFYTTPNDSADSMWQIKSLTFTAKNYSGTFVLQVQDNANGLPYYREVYIDFPAGFDVYRELNRYEILVGPDTDIRGLALGVNAGITAACSIEIEKVSPIPIP